MPRQMPRTGAPPRPLRDELVEAELADPLHRAREGADAGRIDAVGGLGAASVAG